jgi:hypothetical protein
MLASKTPKPTNRRVPKASKMPHVTCDELVIEPIVSQDDGDIVIEKPNLKRSPRKHKLVEELSSIPIDIPISIDEPIVFLPDEDTLQDIPATFVDDVPDVTPVVIVETITCECGAVVSKKSLSKHLKTKKHLSWLASQQVSMGS